MAIAGCDDKDSRQRLQTNQDVDTPQERSFPCSVLLVGNQALGESIRRQWSARFNSECSVTTISDEDLIQSNFEIDQKFDVVIYPNDMMIELLNRQQILPLAKSIYNGETLQKNQFLSHLKKSGIRYDSRPWAVPLGNPLLSMIYRQDVLEERKGTPPKTWEDLVLMSQQDDSALKKEQGTGDKNDDMGWNNVGMPLAPGWAGNSFLAIAAPYVRQAGRLSVLFDRRSMEPQITSEAFVTALQQLKTIAENDLESLQCQPQDILRRLKTGQLISGITWASAAFDQTIDQTAPNQIDTSNLGITSVPGARQYFDASNQTWVKRPIDAQIVVDLHGVAGLLASQTAGGRPRSAAQMLNWLPQNEISEVLFASRPNLGPSRNFHLARPQPWAGSNWSPKAIEDYASNLSASHEHAVVMVFPNILDRRDYYRILDEEVRRYLTSDTPATKALSTIAERWNQRTEKIGRIKQSKLLRRNSNF